MAYDIKSKEREKNKILKGKDTSTPAHEEISAVRLAIYQRQ